MKIKTYTELLSLQTFSERFNYLKLTSNIGEETFGHDRYLNQLFYRSPEWRHIRDFVISRDNGCDLAIPEVPILDRIVVHHINPLEKEDIIEHSEFLLDPEYLICVSDLTHRALHYGDESILLEMEEPVVRRPNDTIPWR